jgi:hypothetical protein
MPRPPRLEIGRKFFWFQQWTICLFTQDVLHFLIEDLTDPAWRKKEVLGRAREMLVLAGKADRIKVGMSVGISEMRDAYSLYEVVCAAIEESGLKLSIRQLRNRLDKAIAGCVDTRAKKGYRQLDQFFEKLSTECKCKEDWSTWLMFFAA